MWVNADTNEQEADLQKAIEEAKGNLNLREYAVSVGEKASYSSYISQVSNSSRPPSDDLLSQLGLERRIIYVKKKNQRRWK